VCAIDQGSVYATAARFLDYEPEIVVTRPVGLEEIFRNIQVVGAAAGVPERAKALVSQLKERGKRITDELGQVAERPKVFCIDWLEPLRNTGQWTPELVELAGGEEGLAEKWGKSREISWDEVAAYQPDYLMVMPCAFDMARTEKETRQHLFSHPTWGSLRAVQKGNVYLFDGLIPSRHGPRVIDVLEGLAEAMHPEKFAGLARPGVFHKAEL